MSEAARRVRHGCCSYVAVLPIQADLVSRAADLQWLVVAYGVVIAGFLLLGGGWGTSSGTGSCSSRG